MRGPSPPGRGRPAAARRGAGGHRQRRRGDRAAGAGPPGAPAPPPAVARGEGPGPEPAWPSARWGGRGRGPRSVRGGFAGRGGRGAGSRAGCGGEGRLYRAAGRNLPEERKDGGGILGDVLCKGHVCTSRSYTSPRQEGPAGDPLPPLLGSGRDGGQRAPAPPGSPAGSRRRQPPAQPRRACLATGLCHRSENEIVPEARSVYK